MQFYLSIQFGNQDENTGARKHEDVQKGFALTFTFGFLLVYLVTGRASGIDWDGAICYVCTK